MKKSWKDSNLLLNEMFGRRRNEDTIWEVDRCYKNFESDLKKKVENYFEEEDFPFKLTSLKYDNKTKQFYVYYEDGTYLCNLNDLASFVDPSTNSLKTFTFDDSEDDF